MVISISTAQLKDYLERFSNSQTLMQGEFYIRHADSYGWETFITRERICALALLRIKALEDKLHRAGIDFK